MSPTVWFKPGTFIVYGSSLDAATHKHHSIQLVWPSDECLCQIGNQEIRGPSIINSQIEHRLVMTAGWVLLVEPQSDFGLQLGEYLQDQAAVAVDCDLADQPTSIDSHEDPAGYLAPLMSELKLSIDMNDSVASIADPRIQQLLTRIDCRPPSDGFQPSHWKANTVAQQLHLSEGRFLHLFREQMGIAWRPYLLWRRTISAVDAILTGSSATEAAHLAGFSDSSHLSRTFRSLFGMSITQSQSLFSRD